MSQTNPLLPLFRCSIISEAVCPLGPGHQPLSSYAEGPIAWIPIIDSANEWVQIARDDACQQYSHMKSEAPEWGMNGIGNEKITRNILCCTIPGMVVDPNATPQHKITATSGEGDAILYELAISNYHPHWFDRSKGWTGQTFEEALDFCDDIEGYNLCPYGMFCSTICILFYHVAD